ncbi:MAG: asparaginase [Planctomycetota bacterium]
MSFNPVLLHLRRGGIVESVHRGAYAIVHGEQPVESRGDVDRPVYPRSALKPFQALPLILSGAADRFGLTDQELTIAAASHNGTGQHLDAVRSLMAKADLRVEHLQCGAHPPTCSAARREMITRGEEPTALHNNCSGKHAGMLLLARHLGAPLETYLEPENPVQKLILETIADLTRTPKASIHAGCDGCNAPTFALPIAKMALGYQRLSDPSGPVEYRRLVTAIQSHPILIAGEGRFCTALLASAPGRFLPKSGAEGFYALGVPERRLAIAIKIDDGQERGYTPVIVSLLERLGLLSSEERARLGRFGRSDIRNWRGNEVGDQIVAELEAEAS